MKKCWVFKVSSKSRTIFIEKASALKQNGVTCMKKTWFYKYPVKVGQFSS